MTTEDKIILRLLFILAAIILLVALIHDFRQPAEAENAARFGHYGCGAHSINCSVEAGRASWGLWKNDGCGLWAAVCDQDDKVLFYVTPMGVALRD